MRPCSGVAGGGGLWDGAAAWALLMKIGNLRHFCNLHKTIQVHEGSYRYLHSNSISRKLSARAFLGVGMMGHSIYFFFHLSRRYHELFSPTTSRTALPRRSGIQKKRKRNYNIIII